MFIVGHGACKYVVYDFGFVLARFVKIVLK